MPDRVRRHRAWALVVVTLVTVLLGVQAAAVQPTYEMEDFLPEGTPERNTFERARSAFGRDDRTAMVVLDNTRAFETDLDALRRIRTLSQRLEAHPMVERVTSLTHAKLPVRRGEQRVALARALPPSLLERPPSDTELRRQIAHAFATFDQPPYRGALLAADHRLTVVSVVLREDAIDHHHRQLLRDELGTLVQQATRGSTLTHRITGYPIQRVDFANVISQDARRLYPMTAVVTAAVVALVLPSVICVVTPLLVAAVAAIWTTGLLGMLGLPPNILAPALYILGAIVGVSNSIHLLTRYRELRRQGFLAQLAIHRALHQSAKPCLLASATTAAAFAALGLVGLPLVGDFGVQVATSVACAYAATFMLVPPLLSYAAGSPLDRTPAAARLPPLLIRLHDFVAQRPAQIVLGTLPVLAFAVAGATRMQVNAPLLSELSPDHPIRQTHQLLEDRLAGVVTADLLIAPPSAADGTEHPYTQQRVERIDALTQRLRTMPGVASATSVADLLHQMAPLLQNVPDHAVTTLLPTAMLLISDKTRTYVDARTGFMRIRLVVKNLDTPDAMSLYSRIQGAADDELGGPHRSELTGQGYLGQVVNQRIVDHFQLSFFVALGGVMVLLLFAGRQLDLTLLTLPVNLLPVAVVAGTLGFTGVDLRYTSALALSIAFGLVVDDTIHFASQIHHARRTGSQDPLRSAYLRAGPGIVATSLVFGGGFAVLAASELEANRVLGLAMFTSCVSALLADLVLFPALLILMQRAFGASRSPS